MQDLDKKLKASIERVNTAQKAYLPNEEQLKVAQGKANKLFYGNEESAKAGREALAISHRAGGFGAIASQVQAMDKNDPVSGVMLFNHLASQVNLFPSQASVEEHKKEFYAAALDSVHIDGDDLEWRTAVDKLWSLMQPTVEKVVLKTIHVNNAMAQVMEEAYENRKTMRKHQGRQ